MAARRLVGVAAVLLVVHSALGSGCQDEHNDCSTWAQNGECKNNPGFMHIACPRSCGTCPPPVDENLTKLGDERVVMRVEGYGEIVLGFFPNAAPVTVDHILKLFRLGCYDTDHIFRVDRGFVAQVQSVYEGAVRKKLSPECREEAAKTVPAEFTAVRHVRGILSMGRLADPNSGGSSFSLLLGKAPHLDRQYTVFGKVLAGDEVLAELEKVETKKEGIFVMPKNRIEITSASVVKATDALEL